MDDYLKIKLDKLTEKQKEEVTDYLLDVAETEDEKRKKEVEIVTMADYTEEAKERLKSWGKVQGLSTGFSKLDDITKGLVAGEITVIAGKTSYGKTTLAINIASRVARAGTPVLFVTLEMTKPEIVSRFMKVDEEGFDGYASMVALQARDELNWKSVDGLVEAFAEQFTNGLVVVDHLHYFTRELDRVSEDLGRITKEMKKNADRHKVPMILISHVRKTPNETTIEDLRGSSYIAQDADIVLLVGRDKEEQNKLFVKIEKNRNRGYDFKNDTRELYIDGIKIYDSKPIFK